MSDAFPISEARLPANADDAAGARGLADLVERCALEADNDPALLSFAQRVTSDGDGRALLYAVFANSPFLTQCILREPGWLKRIFDEGPDKLTAEVVAQTRGEIARLTDEQALMKALRVNKRRISLTAALADIAGLWPLYKVTEALSDFADASTDAATAFVLRRAADRGAFRLKNADDPAQGSGFIVIGMGKLGARELNYSSDIDLICLFDTERIDCDDTDALQNHCTRMTRTLARILDERTVDGYVFRIDLRLRPDPGSTPLAISVMAAESYYESLGQNWERAAMIKARAIAGDIDAGNAFIAHLRPFVWRKNLDFAAIQDIHSIKRQIHAHKGGGQLAINGHNIKLGRGGIREVEFFAQTQQLIWGGRELSVRCRRTVDAIHHLVALDQVTPETAQSLTDSYEFLRMVEHRLQMQRDEQTQTLPDEDEGIAALGKFCGYADVADFRRELYRHLDSVQGHYGALFGNAPSLAADNGVAGNLAFTGVDADPETLKTLKRLGFSEPGVVDTAIRGWHHGRIRATRSTRAREILTELTPMLLNAIARQPDPDATFVRFDAFVAGLPAGIQLFSMFQAYPDLLRLLAEIMGEAPRLAAHLSRRPGLLDSVLSADFYDPLPTPELLRADCAEALADAQFFEDILDATRRWNADRRFQIGIQLLRGVITPTAAAGYFSDTADAVLQTLFPHVISEFAERHGTLASSRFCVLALGKLGSRELTPSSDLDLIFIYDYEDLDAASDGERPLPTSQYFGRLGQRMINAVMSMTAEGTLYEVDMRLRPSGNKGPISTAFDGFQRYYDETAWVWEFMALTRARVIFETGGLGEDVGTTVRALLCRHRDAAETAQAVADMRGRIEKQFGTSYIWAIKQVAGGQVDIDFLAQYLILVHAHKHPAIILPDVADVFRQAESIGALNPDDAAKLVDAKRLYRDLQTFLALTIEGDLNDAKVEAFSAPLREDLAEIGGSPNFTDLALRLTETEQAVREIFNRLLKGFGDEATRTDLD